MEPADDQLGPGRARRMLRFTFAIVLFGTAGLVIWFFGVFAAGQYTEDLCFDDVSDQPMKDLAVSSDFDPWPPSYECHLTGRSVDPVIVQHRLVAIGVTGAWFVLPVVGAVGAVVGAWWLSGRRLTLAACASARP